MSIKKSKSLLFLGVTLVSVLLSPAALAKHHHFNGDWTDTFQLKGGNTVVHTPAFVNLDNMMQAQCIDINAKSFNGIPLTKCGLHLKTNSSRDDFIKSLTCSGLYPAS